MTDGVAGFSPLKESSISERCVQSKSRVPVGPWTMHVFICQQNDLNSFTLLNKVMVSELHRLGASSTYQLIQLLRSYMQFWLIALNNL